MLRVLCLSVVYIEEEVYGHGPRFPSVRGSCRVARNHVTDGGVFTAASAQSYILDVGTVTTSVPVFILSFRATLRGARICGSVIVSGVFNDYL
ncbi:hypothetical protein MRX96_002854 [Rhipicephalus microplus]